MVLGKRGQSVTLKVYGILILNLTGLFYFPKGELVPLGIGHTVLRPKLEESDTWSLTENNLQIPFLSAKCSAWSLLFSTKPSLLPALLTTFFSITGFNFLYHPLCKNFFPDLITISLNSISFSRLSLNS